MDNKYNVIVRPKTPNWKLLYNSIPLSFSEAVKKAKEMRGEFGITHEYKIIKAFFTQKTTKKLIVGTNIKYKIMVKHKTGQKWKRYFNQPNLTKKNAISLVESLKATFGEKYYYKIMVDGKQKKN